MDQKIEAGQSQHQGENRQENTTIQRKSQTLLRINADDYSTKHLVIFWVLYLLVIIAISLLTLALPPTFMSIDNRDTLSGTALNDCSNVAGFDPFGALLCNPVSSTNPTAGLLLRQLSASNQFFFVYITFVIQNKADTLLQINTTNVQLQFYELGQRIGPGGLQFYNQRQIQNQTAQINLIPSQTQRVYESNGYSLKGYRKYFGYQKYVEEKDSLILLTFQQWPLYNVKDYYMEVSTVTPDFTLFSILFRYILFAISLGTSIAYYVRYRLIPQHLRTLEQKMILYLSIFTVMFNDPLYAATILTPNGFTAFLSVAFIVNFLTFLMAFWMVLIDRILYESGQFYDNAINKRKIAYFVVFYISLFVLQFQIALLRFSDSPLIFDDDLKSGGIVAFEVISFLIFAAGLAYIGIQFARSVMNFFDKIWRNQVFLMFSFIYIVVILVMLIIEGFSVYEYTGNRILILFGFMNMYTIYLQYMFSINNQQASKLDRERLIGGGNLARSEVETIASHFGNEEIMVDLDSELGDPSMNHQNTNNPYRVNKYSQNINERLESRQDNDIEQQTHDNLNIEKKNDQQSFSLQE